MYKDDMQVIQLTGDNQCEYFLLHFLVYITVSWKISHVQYDR